MSEKIQTALQRLNSILPLQENQSQLAPYLLEFHKGLLSGFIEYGQTLSEPRMREYVPEPAKELKKLEDAQLLVLKDGQIDVLYPFSSQKRGFNVLVNGWQVQAACALDALSIVPSFNNIDGIVQSQCHVTQTPIMVEQFKNEILGASHEKLHVGIVWSAANNAMPCSENLCRNIYFLVDDKVANDWLAEDASSREIFSLPEAVSLGMQFFKPIIS